MLAWAKYWPKQSKHGAKSSSNVIHMQTKSPQSYQPAPRQVLIEPKGSVKNSVSISQGLCLLGKMSIGQSA